MCRRILCVVFLMCLGGMDAGCAKKEGEAPKSGPPGDVSHAGDKAPRVDEGAKTTKDPVVVADAPKGDVALADPTVGMAKPTRKPPQAPPPGILTAGSFDDNIDPLTFASFARRVSQDPALGDLPARLQGQRLFISVKDATGNPVGRARVKLAGAAGNGVEITTRSDGRAVFVLSWDKLPADRALQATVTAPGGGTVSEVIPAGTSRWEMQLPQVKATPPKHLDLAIVLDTTGSMGDELSFLKSEVGGIIQAVRQKFPEVQQRYALILYRDDGDEYVARTFDFTASLDDFARNLAAQSASGGGDYPEAVHRGLQEANQLRWRESDAAAVLFWIGDAPPHRQHMNAAMQAADQLRKKGVALYPIACSGYEHQTEFVMRSSAYLSGSQFLFLTDDSGVGNSHAEPRIPYYQVERLSQLLVRVIAGELSGRRIDANPADILRTVGRKPN